MNGLIAHFTPQLLGIIAPLFQPIHLSIRHSIGIHPGEHWSISSTFCLA